MAAAGQLTVSENGDVALKVRRGSVADSDRLTDLWALTTQIDIDFLLKRYFSEIASGVQELAICTRHEQAVGQVWVRFRGCDPKISNDRTQCYLHTLFVAPAERRQGVGLALVVAASTLARGRGRDELIIAVDKPNRYALNLYRKWGFAASGQLSDLRGDLILLARPTHTGCEAEKLLDDSDIEFSV